uniref:Uncharacterized protein n=1 Tax=Ascaris lumbricoides TaxID=6252 RepID=A0A0M3IPQ9_ASCLU
MDSDTSTARGASTTEFGFRQITSADDDEATKEVIFVHKCSFRICSDKTLCTAFVTLHALRAVEWYVCMWLSHIDSKKGNGVWREKGRQVRLIVISFLS